MADTIQLKSSQIKEIREKILNEQDGLCAICGDPAVRPVLDHHHSKRVGGTSLCRGVLCSQCNVFLAKLENNASRYGVSKEELSNYTRKMADYLDKDHTNFIHPSEKEKPKTLSKRNFAEMQKKFKIQFPKLKAPMYPKSGFYTKTIEKFYLKVKMEPVFNK